MPPTCFRASSRNVNTVGPKTTPIADRMKDNAPIHRTTAFRPDRIGGCGKRSGSSNHRPRISLMATSPEKGRAFGGGRSILTPFTPDFIGEARITPGAIVDALVDNSGATSGD